MSGKTIRKSGNKTVIITFTGLAESTEVAIVDVHYLDLFVTAAIFGKFSGCVVAGSIVRRNELLL